MSQTLPIKEGPEVPSLQLFLQESVFLIYTHFARQYLECFLLG